TTPVSGLLWRRPAAPRAEGRPPRGMVKRPERLHEALLRGVFGVRGRARDDVSGAERDLLVALHDLLVGGLITALGACDQVWIVRWPALHRNASCTPGAASWFPCNRLALLCVEDADGGYGARLRAPGPRQPGPHLRGAPGTDRPQPPRRGRSP